MQVTFTLNGEPRVLDVPAATSLLKVLRGLGLTGTKEGCLIGVCGVCTIVVDGLPVSACLYLVPCAEGRDVWTVEGMARRRPEVVDAFVSAEGLQCGICTPGQVMTAATIDDEVGPDAGDAELREYLIGNLCRCTGYAAILEAVEAGRGR